jgi:hypothetical protein
VKSLKQTIHWLEICRGEKIAVSVIFCGGISLDILNLMESSLVADRFLRPLDAWCLGSPHVRHLTSLSSFWDSRTPLPSLLLAHFSRFHPLLSRSRGLTMVGE